MFFLWERMKLVVEPTGALAACALLEKKLDAQRASASASCFPAATSTWPGPPARLLKIVV